MSQIERILQVFNLPRDARGEELLEKLPEFDFNLSQLPEGDRFDSLYQTMTQIRQRSTLTEFCAHDKLDLAIFVCCMLKLRIQPNQQILDLFISRSKKFVDTMVIRQHYYNHKKSKKTMQLEIVLGYKFTDLKLTDEARVIFCQFFFPQWVKFIFGGEELRKSFPEVFLVVEKSEMHCDSLKIQIQQLEVKINAKLALRVRCDDALESNKSSSKSFEEKKNLSSENLQKSQKIQPSLIQTKIQKFNGGPDEKKVAFPANICDLFQFFDEPKKLNMADFASVPPAAEVAPKTENESPVMALDFKAMDRGVIGHEEMDDISNALLSIALQSEKSQPERKDNMSLFSSFM